MLPHLFLILVGDSDVVGEIDCDVEYDDDIRENDGCS